MPKAGRSKTSRGRCRRLSSEPIAFSISSPVAGTPMRRRRSEFSVAAGSGLRRDHPREDLVRAGKGEIFGGEIRRKDLDHRLVFDPDLDHMKRSAVADKTLPPGLAGDRLDTSAIGRDAERKM